jgi:hypothetical protein
MNIFVADIGQGKAHFYDSGADNFYGKLPQHNLIDLNIPNIESGDCLVIEDAHLRPSPEHGKTLAQPFSFEQLEKLYFNANKLGIFILAFGQKKTPTARKFSGYDPELMKTNSSFMKKYGISTDEADVRAIAKLLRIDKNAFNALKPFKPERLDDYQEKNLHKFDYIQEANNDLNIARTQGYGFDKYYDYDDAIHQFIENNKEELCNRLMGDGIFDIEFESEFDGVELMEVIGLKYGSKGILNKIKSPSRLYTLVASILRPNGEIRKRGFPPGHKYYGKMLPPNWKYTKANYLGCKPFHMNQGVAASNYKHHMRPGISNFNGKTIEVGSSISEYMKFKSERNLVDKKTRQIWHVIRKMIIEDGLR